ncbi:hypothetical protein Tco_1298215, partial [Tanacetum coccineum]
RKRCRSLVDSVPSSTPVYGSLAPTRADVLPPRKRFRDSYSSKAIMEEDIKVGTVEAKDTKEYEAETSTGDTVELGIDLVSAPIVDEGIVKPVGYDSSDLSGTRDGIVRSFEDMPINLDDALRDFYHHMYEVHVDRIVEIETVQRQLEVVQLIASMVERIESLRLENLKNMTITHLGMTQEAIKELVNRRVEEALAAYKATRAANAFEAESQSQNGSDGDNGNGRNGNGGNENPNGNDRGTEGVVGLIRWCENMETVFHISNCPERYQRASEADDRSILLEKRDPEDGDRVVEFDCKEK